MSRLPCLAEDGDGQLHEVRRQLGRVPNLYAAMANGPAALADYLALLAEARVAGVADAELAEIVAHVALNTFPAAPELVAA